MTSTLASTAPAPPELARAEVVHLGTVTPLWRDRDTGPWDVAVVDRPGTVALTASQPVWFWPNGDGADHAEPWLRYRRGRALIWSWRRGGLRALLAYPAGPGRRRSLRDVSPHLQTVESTTRSMVEVGASPALVDEALHEVVGHLERRLPGSTPRPSPGSRPALWLTAVCYPALIPAVERGTTLVELPTCLTPGLRATSARSVALRLFGSGTTRRQVHTLGRLLTERPVGADVLPLFPAIAAVIGRGLLEPDHLVHLLEARGPGDRFVAAYTPRGVVDVRRMLRPLTTPRRRRLLTQAIGAEDGPRLLLDAARLARSFPAEDVISMPRDLRDLHDEYTCRLHALHGFHRRIRPPRWLDALHGRSAGGELRFVVPVTTGQLRSWGRRMQNCIGSYAPLAADGDVFLLGVERDGSLAYNIELDRSGQVIQFFGPENTAPDQDEAAQVLATLRAHTVGGLPLADGTAT